MARSLITAVSKELRPLLRRLLKDGWDLSFTGNNHIRILPPDGGKPVFISCTPSDRRARAQIVSNLRRQGFEWPAKA